ncbi:uncharacterized protein LOC119672246 [Teleopsis dalmanni]|uniref:uncharacterized protein LOC119672246 n=1 Tax=Teleopsis dalmanni TaxID=139649 RepID=UPI0018CF3393|nr:uncharacterized protein LOC119672246 [Teleopsis dalmanni]XP_037939182.1 uncharacterized protein LOC119672246 [Teleopsis dalmanni]
MERGIDVLRFIAEVKNRPSIWDGRVSDHSDRLNIPMQWQEIADIFGVDIKCCKRKWKNLRDTYRAEVRRAERRAERLKNIEILNDTTKALSKWAYFQPMSFLSETKRTQHGTKDDICIKEDPVVTTPFDVKLESYHSTDDDNDEDDDFLFEKFNSVATPQAARRLSNCISVSNAIATDPNESNIENENCNCSKRSDDQIHFLEKLEREEQKLMQSTRQEIRSTNNICHIGDADYNFLISFLPQMKKMNEYQNLQFRAKMCQVLLNIMTTENVKDDNILTQKKRHLNDTEPNVPCKEHIAIEMGVKDTNQSKNGNTFTGALGETQSFPSPVILPFTECILNNGQADLQKSSLKDQELTEALQKQEFMDAEQIFDC